MGKRKNEPLRAMGKPQRAGTKVNPSSAHREAPVPQGIAHLAMKLLNGLGVDNDVVTKYVKAIEEDDLVSAVVCGKLLSDADVNPFELTWACQVSLPNSPTHVGSANVFSLAHICRAKLVLAWLITQGSEQQAVQVSAVLSDLSICFGDGTGCSRMVDFAREMFEFIFSPRTADQARSRLDDLQTGGNFGPHVERLLRQSCLNFLAKEEESLLIGAVGHPQACSSDGEKHARL